MPLVDAVGPRRAKSQARLGGTDRVIADLGMALRMRTHASAEMPRHHLRAEADAEVGLALPQRHADPVDFPLDVIVRVVGARRPPEDDRPGMMLHRLRQRLAEPRTADVHRIAASFQRLADAAGRRMFLM